MISNKIRVFLVLLLQVSPAIACSDSVLDERYEELDRLARRYSQVRKTLSEGWSDPDPKRGYARNCTTMRSMVEVQDERIRVMNDMKRYCSDAVDLDNQIFKVSADVSVWRSGLSDCAEAGF